MMNTNNHMEEIELKDLVEEFRHEFSFEILEERDDDEEMMRCSSPESIFREMPDLDYTPIDQSNDTIPLPLSPAWSQDSHMEELQDVKQQQPMARTTSTRSASSSSRTSSSSSSRPSQVYYLNAGSTPASSVSRISDFDLNSGTIQRLNF